VSICVCACKRVSLCVYVKVSIYVCALYVSVFFASVRVHAFFSSFLLL